MKTESDTNNDIELIFNSNTIQQNMDRERLKILNKNLSLSLASTIICASLIYFSVQQLTTVPYFTYWYMAMLGISLLRLSFLIIYRNTPKVSNTTHLIYFSVGALATSASWGIINSLLMPIEDQTAQMIIIVITAGISSGAIHSLQINLPLVLSYISLIIVPLCIWLFMQDGLGYFAIFLSMIIYYVFVMVSAFNSNKILNQFIRLHYINLNLIEDVTKTNFSLQQNNDILSQQEHDMAVINTLNQTLQLCQNEAEAFQAIKSAGDALFSKINGGLTVSTSNNSQQLAATWGKTNILKSHFPINDCWALRSGNIYKAQVDKLDFKCKHYEHSIEGCCMCIPLTVSNKSIGMLNFNSPNEALLTNQLKQIVTIFSETIKLALSNIKLQEQLRHQASHDPLTGLFNRRHLNEVLDRELNYITRIKGTLCLAFIDVDHFKTFNDTYGHDAGDEVLKMTSQILANSIRQIDIPCRFGGEEFVLVLMNTNIPKILPVLEKIRKDIADMKIQFKDQLLENITISIGVAEAPKDGATLDDIVNAADNALYNAKNSGRNRIIVAGETNIKSMNNF